MKYLKYILAIVIAATAGVVFVVYWAIGACFLILMEILEFGIKLYNKVKRSRMRGHKQVVNNEEI